MELTAADILFYLFGFVSVVSALMVVFVSNPIYSALLLAVVMSILGIFFFNLEAHFIAAAQVVVYAGAVMVLFVMVMMLFDLKREKEEVARFSILTVLKIISVGVVCGVLVGAGAMITGDGMGFIKVSTTEAPPPPSMLLKSDINAPTKQTTNPEELKDEVVEITQNPQAGVEIFTKYTDTQKLSLKLFSKYIFIFELLSVLLLVAIVGAVALARSKGGTHHVTRGS
ncbi:MAG: NADH-quinone oxidoreductase subunit J [Oligoflexia bacterium]|nr:NADH-quinone oxidoreductase subunit J [Oligoflexia bacterium]